MGNYAAVWGKPPSSFRFGGNEARVNAEEFQIQPIINHFQTWLPTASHALKRSLEEAAQRATFEKRERLRRERELEEAKMRVRTKIAIN
jgi:hypothetical protein